MRHRDMIVIDPMENIMKLFDRNQQYNLVKQCLAFDGIKGFFVCEYSSFSSFATCSSSPVDCQLIGLDRQISSNTSCFQQHHFLSDADPLLHCLSIKCPCYIFRLSINVVNGGDLVKLSTWQLYLLMLCLCVVMNNFNSSSA